MKSLIFSLALATSLSAFANDPKSPCTEGAKILAYEYMVATYKSERFVRSLYGPDFVTATSKSDSNEDVLIFGFNDGQHDVADVTYYYVRVSYLRDTCDPLFLSHTVVPPASGKSPNDPR